MSEGLPNWFIKQLRELFFHLFILKKGGILSISELAGDPDKMSTTEIRKLCEGAGFTLDKIHGNERNYTANFRKK